MSFQRLCLALALATVLAACGSNEKGTEITSEQYENLRLDKANAGKRLSMTGYPAVLGDQRIGADQKATLQLMSKPNGEGTNLGVFDVRLGEGKNEIYLPQRFTLKDLKVFDNEGHALTANDKVTVSFTVDLDTKRPPNTRNEMKLKNGVLESVSVTSYFGQGPVDIRIDKAP